MRYAYKRHYEWSSDIAYLVGLFASDGCLLNDGRHLVMTSKDLEIINHTKRIANTNATPRSVVGGYGTKGYQLQFSNVALYDFFLGTGLTPAKSKTLMMQYVPDAYFADFFRGVFDGNGCIYGYKDKRWPNSYMYYVTIASASPAFLDWLALGVLGSLKCSLGSIHASNGAEQLSYAKTDSKKLFQAMYASESSPRLTRKYLKFVDFLQSDPYAYKELNARVL